MASTRRWSTPACRRASGRVTTSCFAGRFHADGTVARPARISVIHNGILVQDNVELFGPTTWLQHLPYQRHPDKLSLSLQDHGDPVRYRNIWLRELPEPQEPGGLAEQAKSSVNLSADELKKFVGAYGSTAGALGTIQLHDGHLQMHAKTGQVIDLIPRSKTEFAMRFTAGKLVFDVNDEKQATGFTMHLGGEQYPVRRLASTP